MADSALIAHVDTSKITRQDLALIPTPAGTATNAAVSRGPDPVSGEYPTTSG